MKDAIALISIVIANYNYGRFLEEAIQSVLRQCDEDMRLPTGDRIELIIVDGGSSDNSADVIKKYENKLSWWCSEPDKGQSDAFNKGFSHSTGRYLTWLNADDVFLPGALAAAKEVIEKHQGCEWFVGGCFWLDADLRIIKCTRAQPFSFRRVAFGELPVWAPSSFFSRELFRRVGGVDVAFHYMMDTELWFRFFHNENVKYVPINAYCWGLRLHPDAKMSGHNFRQSPLSDPNHPSMIQKQREAGLIRDRYGVKSKMPFVCRILVSTNAKMIKSKFDSILYNRRHYMEVFSYKKPYHDKLKLAVLSCHPAPYRDPLFNNLARNNGVLLNVFSLEKNDAGHGYWNLHPPKYVNKVWKCWGNPRAGHFCFHPSVIRVILFEKYSVVFFPGFIYLTCVVGTLLCMLRKIPYVIDMDSVESGRDRRFAGQLKKLILNNALFLFVPGEASKRFLLHAYSIPEKKICKGSYLVDAVEMRNKIDAHRGSRLEIRKKYAISDKHIVFLMVANMLPNRCYPLLSEAFSDVSARFPDMLFLMVGRGLDYGKMKQLEDSNPNKFRVINGCSFDEMQTIYSIADVYVHGGQEPYSTALVIGAIAGLPLVSSQAVGAAWDCLVDGDSGVLVKDHNSKEAWVTGLKRMMVLKDMWQEMGSRASMYAQQNTIESVSQDIIGRISGLK